MAEKAGYRALHAQGDPRAAVGGARDGARPHVGGVGPRLPRGDGARRRRRSRAIERVVILGVRHVLARGPGRQVPDRRAGARAGRSGLQLRVPLPPSDRRRAHARGRRSRSRARRPTRSARCARRSGSARGASRSATSSAAWPRARPTAPSTRTPGRRSASRRRRRSRRSSSRCTCWRSRSARRAARSRPIGARALIAGARAAAGRHRGGARRPNDAIEALAKRSAPASRFPVSRPRHQLPDRARGRAEAEGDLLHPRRGLSGRRDEARADRADRRGPAGRRASPPTTASSRRRSANIQEAKARGGAGDRRDERVEGRGVRRASSIPSATSS